MLTSISPQFKKDARLISIQTAGEGDCSFHAVFGVWDQNFNEFRCPELINQRKNISEIVRQCKKGDKIWPSVVEGIQQLIIAEKGDCEIQKLKKQYHNFAFGKAVSVLDAWTVFEEAIKQCPEIMEYISDTFKTLPFEKQEKLDSFHRVFSECLTQNESYLYGLIMSFEGLHELFKEYNIKESLTFDFEQAITQEVLEEYANTLEKKGHWLLPGELAILAYATNITIEFYIKGNLKKSKKFIESYNPDQDTVVRVFFNGVNHYSRLLNEEEYNAIIANKKNASVPLRQQIPLSPNTYLMRHLLQGKFRGSEYPLSVLMLKVTHLLSQKIEFEAQCVSFEKGSLEDIVIHIKGEKNLLEVYQVKDQNTIVGFQDFFNENWNDSKLKKMHIGKFFAAWLQCKKRNPDVKEENISCILHTNVGLDALLSQVVQGGRFSEDFINKRKKISINRSEKIFAISQDFLTKIDPKVSNNASNSVWEELKKEGILDNLGNMVEIFFQSREMLSSVLSKSDVFKEHLKALVDFLSAQYEIYKNNQIDGYELLYQEAFTYIQKEKSNDDLFAHSEAQKREIFTRFLKSFHFETLQPNLQAIELKIQENLIQFLKIPSNQVFLCLYFAIQQWFQDPRLNNEAPKLTSKWLRDRLEQTLIENGPMLSLYGRSLRALETISYSIQEKSVHRSELAALQEGVSKENVVFVQGSKGVGKSALVKQMLTCLTFCRPEEYLFVPAHQLANRGSFDELIVALKNSTVIHYLVVDGAENLLFLEKEKLEIYIQNLKALKQKLIFTLTPEGGQSAVWMKHIKINVNPFSGWDILASFPQLYEYQNISSLMDLCKNPFYLSRVISFLEKNDRTEIHNQTDKALEKLLMKFSIEGQNPTHVQERQLLCARLAYIRAKGSETHLLSQSEAFNALIQEKILIKHEDAIEFTHDLYYEYALMSSWNQEWEMAYIKGGTEAFWVENEMFFKQKNINPIFKKWINLYSDKLIVELGLPGRHGYFGDLNLTHASCRAALFPLFARLMDPRLFRAIQSFTHFDRVSGERDNLMPIVQALSILLKNTTGKYFESYLVLLVHLVALTYPELSRDAYEGERYYRFGFLYEDDLGEDSMTALSLLTEVFNPNSVYAKFNDSSRMEALKALINLDNDNITVVCEYVLKLITDPDTYLYSNKISFLEFREKKVCEYYQKAILLLEELGIYDWENEYLSEQIYAYDKQKNTHMPFAFDKSNDRRVQDSAYKTRDQELISTEDVPSVVRGILDRYKPYEGNWDLFMAALNGYQWTHRVIFALVDCLLEISDTGPEVLLGIFYLNQADEEFFFAMEEDGLAILEAFNVDEIQGLEKGYQKTILEAWNFLFVNWLNSFNQELSTVLLAKASHVIRNYPEFFIAKCSNKEPNVLDALLSYPHSCKIVKFFLENIKEPEFESMLNSMAEGSNQKSNRFLLAYLPLNELIAWCDTEENALRLSCMIPITLEEERLKEQGVLEESVQVVSVQAMASSLLKAVLNKFSGSFELKEDIKRVLERRVSATREKQGLERAYFDQAKHILSDLSNSPNLKAWAIQTIAHIQALEDERFSSSQPISAAPVFLPLAQNGIIEGFSARFLNRANPTSSTAGVLRAASRQNNKRTQANFREVLPSSADGPFLLPHFQAASSPMEIDESASVEEIAESSPVFKKARWSTS